MRAAELRA
jgi:hypothetical protein